MVSSRCRCCEANDAHWLCQAASGVFPEGFSFATPRRLRRHHVLMLEGAEATHVYIVRRGHVRLFKALDDGRELVLRFVSTGDVFGLECLDGRPSSYTAEVVRNAEVCAISASNLQRTLDRHPELMQKLLGLVIADLLYAQEMLINLGVRSARERVAAFLVRRYRDAKRRDGEAAARIVLEVSRRQLADHLGLASETLIRTLTDLHREQVVRIDGRTLDVIDADRLSQYAN